MKKVFLSLIGLASIATASAQFSLGAKAGAQLSRLNGGSVISENAEMKVGYYGGAYGRFHFTKTMAVQAEVLYSAQGTKKDVYDSEAKYNLDYINVPVMFQYHLPLGLYLETGPQIGFLTKAESDYKGAKLDRKNVTKSTDLSWVAGAGFKITDDLGVNARYNIGITDINDAEMGGTARNNVIQLGISWKLFGTK
ncbi:MAG: PorT family protein [Chitinophagaceae bacterium]|nr:PorT family protein [Chitinophagaceae bacterium]